MSGCPVGIRSTTTMLGLWCLLALSSGSAVAQSGEEDYQPPRMPPESGGELAPAKAQAPAQLKAPGQVQQVAPVGGAWTAQGPGPTQNGQVENLQGGAGDLVDGAIHAIAVHPSNANILYVGAVNGGIWRTMNATAVNPTWTPLTDQFPSLSISSLEFDPTDGTNQTLVAGIGLWSNFSGSPGGPLTGLLKTTDGGNTWTQLGAIDLAGRNVASVAPRGNTILVAVNGGTSPGVYRSTNGGGSFPMISGMNGLNNGAAFDLARDPSNNNRIYAGIGGGSGGVFRTDDGGANWTDVTDVAIGALVGGGTSLLEIAVSPAAGNPVFAGIVNGGQLAGVFRSADMGGNWTGMDLPRTLDRTLAIANATNAAPIVITTAVNHGYSTGDQVRVAGVVGNTAANGDFTITSVNNTMFSLNGSAGNGAYGGGGTASVIQGIHHGGQGGINFAISGDPGNGNLVYVGGDRQDVFPSSIGANDFSARLFRGDASVAPGGAGAIPSPQWTALTHNGTTSNSAGHADSRDMAFDANGNLLESDDGGIYRRTSPANNNGDWAAIVGDIQVTEFHDVSYDNISEILTGGAQDTGAPRQTGSGSPTWTSEATADGGDVAIDDFTAPGLSVRFWSTQRLGGFSRRGCLFGICGGSVGIGLNTLSGTPIQPGNGGNCQFVTPIKLNSQDGSRLIIGAANDVYESMDRGDNVTQLNGPGANRNAMEYGHANNADLIVVGSGSQVFVRTTAGGSLTATAGNPPGASTITDVVLNPADENEIFVIDTGTVFRTTDGGANWTDITGNLGDNGNTNFRALEYVPGAINDKLVVGTQDGVFAAVAPHFSCWFELGSGLPNAPVWDLEYDATDALLAAGTLGRGAWTLEGVADIEVPVLTVPGDVDFGDTCVGSTATQTLDVCNTGKEDLQVEDITTSDSQFAVTEPSSGYPVVISPDFCFPFQATFTPTSKGPKSATLTITSNDPCGGAGVDLRGNGTEQNIATVIADNGSYGDVCRGSFKDLALTISNSGGCDLTVTGISSSGPDAALFQLASVMVFPVVIGAGDTLAVPIRFAPGAATPFGMKSATITVNSDDPDTPMKNVAVSANVPPGDVRVTGSTDFGDVCAGPLAEKSLSVCNVGKCDLQVLSVALDPACLDFTLINNPFPAPVSPDSCEEVVIRFTPTSCGEKSCQLTITTDDPDTPVIVKTVTANTPCASIDVPEVEVFPPTVIQSIGSCHSQNPYPVSNTGVCPLTIVGFSVTSNTEEYSLAARPSLPIILETGHVAGEGDLEAVFGPTGSPALAPDRDRLGEVTVTYVSDPVTGATMNAMTDLCGEAVRTGARVLVSQGGIPLASVESIKISRINANRNRNLLDTVDNARNLPLVVVSPTLPCPPFKYHREYGTVSNPIQLLPGSYQITVTAIINGKRMHKTVGFDVTTCGFNPSIVVNF